MEKEMSPAVSFYAASFIARILSFDEATAIEVRLYENQFSVNFDPGVIMTPEEAEGHGIDLFEIIDPGAGRIMTLGEELRDWRTFCRAEPAQMRDMGNDFLWLGDLGQTVWKNPRIEAYIREKDITITVFETPSVHSVSSVGVLADTLNIVPANREAEITTQVQRDMTPPDGSIVENWNECTLTVVEGRREKRLSNFIPVPLCREYRIKADGDYDIWYVVEIYVFGIPPVQIRVKDLKRLYFVARGRIDSLAMHHSKGYTKLEAYLRERLGPLDPRNDKKILVSPGWQVVDGKHYYVVDNRPQTKEYFFECGRSIVCYQMEQLKMWETFCGLLHVSNDLRITATAMLFQILGLSYTLFDEGGFKLQFALYLVGTTGSLKTSLAKAVFQIFQSPETGRSHTFSDTATAVEQYIGYLKDEVGLVDDFELGEDFKEESRQKAIFTNIMRYVGDSKGKNRSNPVLEDVKATTTHGLVALTGEQTIGKQSTRLRMVELEITKGAINGEKLTTFQQDPRLWASVCWAYISWIEANYEAVCSYICEYSRKFRQEYQGKFPALRTIDQLISFRLCCDLLVQFWSSVGILPDEVHQTIEQMFEATLDVLSQGTEQDEIENPGIRFALALSSLIGSGTITLADSRGEMLRNTNHIGFKDEFGDIWLLRDESYIAVRDHMQRLRIRFPFDMRKILKSLDELGCIEGFSNGHGNRTYNSRKDGRTYFKVKGERFRELVEKNQGK